MSRTLSYVPQHFNWSYNGVCLRPPGDISIGIKCAPGVVGPAEADIDFDIIRNDNDTFTVKYTPPGAGSYTIMVLFADQVSRLVPRQSERGGLRSELNVVLYVC